jgi:hypothetical protein
MRFPVALVMYTFSGICIYADGKARTPTNIYENTGIIIIAVWAMFFAALGTVLLISYETDEDEED